MSLAFDDRHRRRLRLETVGGEALLLDLPKEVEEAARLDGLSWLQIIFRLILPMAAPGIAVTTIFTFVFSWNEFLFAVFLTYDKAQTMPVAPRQPAHAGGDPRGCDPDPPRPCAGGHAAKSRRRRNGNGRTFPARGRRLFRPRPRT